MRKFTKYPSNYVKAYQKIYDDNGEPIWWRTDVNGIDDVIEEIKRISYLAGTEYIDVIDYLDDLLDKNLITRSDYDTLVERAGAWRQGGYKDLF